MKTTTLLFLLLAGIGMSYAQDKASSQLVVKVENIKNVKGRLKLAVYDQHDHFLKSALTWGDEVISGNTLTYTFSGLKEGTYAVSIFQDENENGKLDANLIGIPSEPYAFSNNARGLFGPPSFEDCQFEITNTTKELVISL